MAGPNVGSAREIAAILSSSTFEELPPLIERYRQDPRSQVQKALESATRRLKHHNDEVEATDKLYEYELRLSEGVVALGVDEVGRGAVCGPLTVCALALPKTPRIVGIKDSKQLSAPRREALAQQIKDQALGIGISHIEPQTIDALGMGLCLRKAMAEAIEKSGLEPEIVLIDGNPVHAHPKERCVVKGDASVASIAAASIVAKVTRDALMIELSDEYPEYELAKNKGYASKEHIQAIKNYGLTPYHRMSFCGNFFETMRLF